ncbi:MAG: Uma2 family endonuclease [Pirellulales bacterium]
MASDQDGLTASAAGDVATWIPPLEPGDRLSREEFERRYRAMPEIKKAELIEGVVYMPSPARYERHSDPHAAVVGCLYLYSAGTPGVKVADNSTVRLDFMNEPQPDAILFIEPECGGQVRISADDYVEEAPELVVEIASSSASYDLGPKLESYRRNEVREYIVWRVLDREIDWFVLTEGEYRRLEPGDDGLFRSKLFPGLWLDRQALLEKRHVRVVECVQLGLQSQEHAAFVERLAAARAGSS